MLAVKPSRRRIFFSVVYLNAASKPNVAAFSHRFFSTTLQNLKEVQSKAQKYKSKRTKLAPEKRIQTPEELFHSASNVDIENLKKDVEERTKLRYIEPNKLWISKIFPDLKLPPNFSFYDDQSNRDYIKYQLVKKFGDVSNKFVWKDFQYNEVAVGDVVDLSGNFEKGDLSVIIGLPEDPEDPRYTLLNAYGEIQFVSRSKMGVRLPKVFPKEWFCNSLMEEELFWEGLDYDEIVPIGKPKYKLEDVIDRNKIFESAIARSISGENAVKTYILPSLLSGLVSQILSKINTKAWQILPNTNVKLEIVHNILQSNEGPIQITLYQMYRAVQLTDLKILMNNLKVTKAEDISKAYKLLFDTITKNLFIGNQYDSISLGKTVCGGSNLNLEVDIVDFYAFILGLRKNNQLFMHDAFTKASSYVLALPLNRIVRFNGMVQAFKDDNSLYPLLSGYLKDKIEQKNIKNANYKKILPFYITFIDLLKLYCSGSVQNNILESFVMKIMRNIPDYKDLDITNSIVFDLLLKTNEITSREGPSKWWDNAMLPFSGVSLKADMEQAYYDSITEENISSFVDLEHDSTDKRVKFNDIVYCIDSENPLEIDDGISVKKLNQDEYLVSTFVADPSSYLEPEDLISRIALERGLTLYLPDLSGTNAIPLLPLEFGKKIQLGYFGQDTRALKISFKYNEKTKRVVHLSDDEVINFGVANRFVKIDYNSVNKLLSNDPLTESILHEKLANSDIPISQVKQDLHSLSIISQHLNDEATKSGRISLFDQINVKKEIANITENEDKQIQLVFKDIYNDDTIKDAQLQGAKSEQLVSEIMVKANNIAGNFFARNKIPAIYKIQLPLEMSPQVAAFSKNVTLKKNADFKDLTIYQEYLTKSTIAPFPEKHEFLNITRYATVTSPLRRFWDFVNHWQLHSFLSTGKPKFTQDQIDYMTLQLKYKDELNTKLANKVIGFYTFKALQYLQEHQGQEGQLLFKVIVTKKPSEDGLIEVILLDYGVRCILETSWYALNAEKADTPKAETKDVAIGDIIDDATIKDIDLLDGSILLTSKSV